MRYEFGGKVYTQEKLVWGQVRQIASALKGVSFQGEVSVAGLIDMVGDRLSSVLAIVLTEEGALVKDKDLDTLAKEIETTIPIDVLMQVVEDFFICNPMALVLEKLTGLVGGVQKQVENLQNLKAETSNTLSS
jgi:hypothetical protein